ncbi:hypothetical protein L3Y34_006677 [Caenorhabditis briggsae]|uniref:Uncharacterized protein n=1 Tax=Caenorhabditis briggsae TaxID=6238 RepID=A0AAE8ZY08_CAEBR|nr:hypothetical protein L3Y34_006677 [Caenorhabditis briggsae]
MSRPDKRKNQRQDVARICSFLLQERDISTTISTTIGDISTTISTTIGDIRTTRTLYDLGHLLNCVAQKITVPIRAPRKNKDSPHISKKKIRITPEYLSLISCTHQRLAALRMRLLCGTM